jgi:hypothetical protein
MRRWVTFATVFLLQASPALADGDGPTRKLTGPETAAFNALSAAVREALPKAPENYTLASGGSDSVGFELPEAIKPDGMARMTFTATYTLSREFQDGQQRASMTDRAKGTPEQQAKLAALDAKDAELSKARNNTRDRGEKDRIRAELKAVQAEANQIRDQIMAEYQSWVMSGGANAALQNLNKALPAKEFTVKVLLNQDLSVNDKAVPYRIPEFPLAFEQDVECQRFDNRCLTVLLGPFDREKRVSGYTRYNLRSANLGVPTKPRGMAIVVEGPKDKPQSVRDFLGKIDLKKLKSLLP